MGSEGLVRVAARQYSLFTRPQARQSGLSARRIDHGVVTGRWDRLYRGVFRMAGAPVTDHQRILAAVLACGDGAMASHRAAAWLWGLTEDPYMDVTSPLHRSIGPAVTVHRCGRDLRSVVRQAIRCTGPLRTIVDLAGMGDRSLLEHALDRGAESGLVATRVAAAELDRRAGKGVAGIELLRACLLERLDGCGSERTSVLESVMDRLLVRHRLPLPERQYCVPGTRYRLDYAWPPVRVYVEVDGYADHAGLDPFRYDRRRQNNLALLGWTVLRFTWDDVRRRPAQVAAAIRQALSAARHWV